MFLKAEASECALQAVPPAGEGSDMFMKPRCKLGGGSRPELSQDAVQVAHGEKLAGWHCRKGVVIPARPSSKGSAALSDLPLGFPHLQLHLFHINQSQ